MRVAQSVAHQGSASLEHAVSVGTFFLRLLLLPSGTHVLTRISFLIQFVTGLVPLRKSRQFFNVFAFCIRDRLCTSRLGAT